ncbi:hypothetical protein [Martelella alba]|uniref:Uncharacterized protein n=1 Tax=Martelella alba TaxID=2590451 RepID=A0ABY2SDF0_9HYPH|nr:hypothetical protein [Martelella alba]TKI02392.1 hypothetical protein FCN80_25190 [Martelella alba]
MNNLDKLMRAAFVVYGKNWQSPISRDLGISDRTIRNFISGKSRTPEDMSNRLLQALEQKKSEIQEAIDLVNSDMVQGDDVSIELITEIASRYKYRDEQDYKSAIDAMNNAVYETTYLSDLEQIAINWSYGKQS